MERTEETVCVNVECNLHVIYDELESVLQHLAATLKTELMDMLEKTFANAATTIRTGLAKVESALTKGTSKLKHTVKEGMQGVADALDPIDTEAVNKLSSIVEKVEDMTTSMIQKVTKAVNEIGTKQAEVQPIALAATSSAGSEQKDGDSGIKKVSDFMGDVQKQFTSLNQLIMEVAPQLSASLQPFVDTITVGLSVASGFLENIVGWVDIFNQITAVMPMLQEGLQTLFTVLLNNPFTVFLAAAVVALFALLYTTNEEFRTSINQLTADFLESLGPGIAIIQEAMNNLWNNALLPLSKAFQEFSDMVIQPLAKVLSDIFAIAVKTVYQILTSLWNNVLVPLAAFFLDTFAEAVQGALEVWEAWKPGVQKVMDVFMLLWNSVLKPLVDFIAGTFAGTLDSIFQSISAVIGNIKGIFSGLISFVTGVFTGNWQKAWQGVRDIFKNIFGGLMNLIKGPLNSVVDLVNRGIDGINSIGFDLPELLGGGHFGLHIPHIPRLAQGGILRQPTLAMLGEAGAEAVLPLEHNTGWIAQLANRIQAEAGKNDNHRSEELLLELIYAVRSLNLNIDGKKAVSLFAASKNELAMLK